MPRSLSMGDQLRLSVHPSFHALFFHTLSWYTNTDIYTYTWLSFVCHVRAVSKWPPVWIDTYIPAFLGISCAHTRIFINALDRSQSAKSRIETVNIIGTPEVLTEVSKARHRRLRHRRSLGKWNHRWWIDHCSPSIFRWMTRDTRESNEQSVRYAHRKRRFFRTKDR